MVSQNMFVPCRIYVCRLPGQRIRYQCVHLGRQFDCSASFCCHFGSSQPTGAKIYKSVQGTFDLITHFLLAEDHPTSTYSGS